MNYIKENLSQTINNNVEVIILGITLFSIIIMILLIIQMVSSHKLKVKYKRFMSGSTGNDLESQILTRFSEIDQLKIDYVSSNNQIQSIEEKLSTTYQKIGVVKYDAFKEMGGKLSFVLALLDKNNNGILLNSVHSSREGCYTYLKEIINGESFLELSEDERDALKQAVHSNNYMG